MQQAPFITFCWCRKMHILYLTEGQITMMSATAYTWSGKNQRRQAFAPFFLSPSFITFCLVSHYILSCLFSPIHSSCFKKWALKLYRSWVGCAYIQYQIRRSCCQRCHMLCGQRIRHMHMRDLGRTVVLQEVVWILTEPWILGSIPWNKSISQ